MKKSKLSFISIFCLFLLFYSCQKDYSLQKIDFSEFQNKGFIKPNKIIYNMHYSSTQFSRSSITINRTQFGDNGIFNWNFAQLEISDIKSLTLKLLKNAPVSPSIDQLIFERIILDEIQKENSGLGTFISNNVLLSSAEGEAPQAHIMGEKIDVVCNLTGIEWDEFILKLNTEREAIVKNLGSNDDKSTNDFYPKISERSTPRASSKCLIL